MMRSIFPRQCRRVARNTNSATKPWQRRKHYYLRLSTAVFFLLLIPFNKAKAQSPDTWVNGCKLSNCTCYVCVSSDFIDFRAQHEVEKYFEKSQGGSRLNSFRDLTCQCIFYRLSDNNDNSTVYFAFANNREPSPSVRNQEGLFGGLGRETIKSEKTSVGLINDRKYMPRFDFHDACTIYPGRVLFDVRVRGANSSGRRLINTQRFVTFGITPSLDVWFSDNKVTFLGRDRSNRFDVRAEHFGVKYNILQADDGRNPISLIGEYVHASTATVITTDSLSKLRSPATFVFSVVGSKSLGEGKTGTLGCLLSRSTLLNFNNETTYGLLGGVNWDLKNRLMVRGGTGLFLDSFGKGWSPVFSGSLSYMLRMGLYLEIGGMFAPQGLPLSGTSLTGASAFQLHFPGDGLVRDFSSNTFGAYMLRLVYRIKL